MLAKGLRDNQALQVAVAIGNNEGMGFILEQIDLGQPRHSFANLRNKDCGSSGSVIARIGYE